MNARATWQQAVDAQIEQYLWLRSGKGTAWFRDKGRERDLDEGDVRESYELELEKMFYGDPVFVAAEMCDLIEVAARTFQPEPLLASDVLTPVGFLYFERPVEVLATRHNDDQIRLVFGAFAWSLIEFEDDAHRQYKRQGHPSLDVPSRNGAGIDLSYFVDWNATRLRAGKRQRADEPRLSFWRGTVLPFDQEPRPDDLDQRRLVQSTLRLMAEFKPVSRYTRAERPDRATRKRVQRAGLPEREVTVVRLRRERTLAERVGGSADYAYRFMVSGHWRNQWFPSQDRHRQIWVAPYVKGPSDKPFKPPQGRVFNFFR